MAEGYFCWDRHICQREDHYIPLETMRPADAFAIWYIQTGAARPARRRRAGRTGAGINNVENLFKSCGKHVDKTTG